ncbi:Common plant regulatory factor [Sarracenia purpurea var. burkii]
MGSSEAMTSPKSEKASPKQEQTNIHLYSDWATIQAYYGPRIPIPPSYLNSAVMAGPAPHPHMWAPPQILMPPYGMPYSAIYSHSPGVVYAHPVVPLAATPVGTELASNSSNNMDQSLGKKLKRLDGVPMQGVNVEAEVDGEGSVLGPSQSVEGSIEASSNVRDGNSGVVEWPFGLDYVFASLLLVCCDVPWISVALGGGLLNVDDEDKWSKDNSLSSHAFSNPPPCNFLPVIYPSYQMELQDVIRETWSYDKTISSYVTDSDVKLHTQASPVNEGDANVTFGSILEIVVATKNVAGPPVDSPNGKAEAGATSAASPAAAGLPSEVWIQDERLLKRERRKQANRESARRSRLRKQAETEELLKRYETLKVENIALNSEINQLTEKSEKLQAENASLMEKLNGVEITHIGETVLDEIGPDLAQPNHS